MTFKDYRRLHDLLKSVSGGCRQDEDESWFGVRPESEQGHGAELE